MKKIISALVMTGFSSVTMAADLGPSCTEYFKKLDEVVAASPHGEAMKTQYDTVKKQMASMPGEAQEAACKQAADLMSQAMANMPAK
ncbi:DUF5339 domain-containing protein [Pseudomonas fragi]|uniref:DUF5339 domain-containing protein n=1 Tax=Pseudomonas fragi TaxID=296 RepID=UPI0021C189E3|nr:DUF5339 domain-containing protein [Pseudomonas fragi]UXL37062.1 DUF5339 domain-containing protein [Pseudomonas fragi]